MKNLYSLSETSVLNGPGLKLSKLTSPAFTVGLALSLFLAGCSKDQTITKRSSLMAIASSPTAIAAPTVKLGTAAHYTILSQAGITTTGATLITGNVAVSPITGAAMTGFGVIMDKSGAFSTSSLVMGKLYGANYSAETQTVLSQAVEDMQAAFNAANLLPCLAENSVPAAGVLNGQSLAAGVYKYGSSLMISGSGVTLTGSASSVYVFQIGSSLTVAAGTKINLGKVKASNVFWIVGSAATFGANANFSGIILAKTAVTLCAGDMITGRIFAQTAVTMISDTVTDI